MSFFSITGQFYDEDSFNEFDGNPSTCYMLIKPRSKRTSSRRTSSRRNKESFENETIETYKSDLSNSNLDTLLSTSKNRTNYEGKDMQIVKFNNIKSDKFGGEIALYKYGDKYIFSNTFPWNYLDGLGDKRFLLFKSGSGDGDTYTFTAHILSLDTKYTNTTKKKKEIPALYAESNDILKFTNNNGQLTFTATIMK